MSYALTAYIVDFNNLKSALGSKDDLFINAVDEIILKTCEDDGDEIESQKSALRTLVNGEPLDLNEGSLYGRVLWQICKVRGEELLPDIWGDVRWEAVEVCGLEDLLTKSQSPFGLPVSRDIPYVGCIKHHDIQTCVETVSKQMAKNRDLGATELLEEFITWLQAGISRKKDMIFFYG